MTESTRTPVVVGPCSCGGYGVVYNAETALELDTCHETADELMDRSKQAVREAEAIRGAATDTLLQELQRRTDIPWRGMRALLGGVEEAKEVAG